MITARNQNDRYRGPIQYCTSRGVQSLLLFSKHSSIQEMQRRTLIKSFLTSNHRPAKSPESVNRASSPNAYLKAMEFHAGEVSNDGFSFDPVQDDTVRRSSCHDSLGLLDPTNNGPELPIAISHSVHW